MNIINVTADNFEQEYVPCVDLQNPNSSELFSYRKQWLLDRFEDGLIIRKFDTLNKAFIEYLPAEYAWKPVLAPGYVLIQHLYVEKDDELQSLKSELIQTCETDSKDENGVVIILENEAFNQNREFLMNRGYLEYDHSPHFTLVVKKFKPDAPSPVLYKSVRDEEGSQVYHGIMITYADQSSFVNYYIYEMKKDFEDMGFDVRLRKLNSAREAKESGSPLGTFGVFLNGHFLTHKLMNRHQIEVLIGSLDLNELYPEVKHLIEEAEGEELLSIMNIQYY